MLAEQSLSHYLQWSNREHSRPPLVRETFNSIARACATHGNDKKHKNQKTRPSTSRHLRFSGAYEDDGSDSDSDRMLGLASALSDTSTSATLSSDHMMEQENPSLVTQKRVQKRGKLTRDWPSMEPFDSASIEQMKDEDLWHFRHGPLPGDLAEIEAFCRIFRLAEQVHNAVMDALRYANDARELAQIPSDVSNGSFSVDEASRVAQDVPLLEEKVVSALGCIGALLHQQKQEVLSGRLDAGFTPVARHDSMPPLALFRAEMKRCCEELESWILCYFPLDDGQFKSMHKKFQKLRNICLDAGYTRSEGSPSHADIPNWGIVKSRTPWSDERVESDFEIAFWRGGQLTDDGIQWLIDKGFKVIVDMRTEKSADYLAKSVMDNAISMHQLKLIHLPIEIGSNPTKDQVVEFARLVADPNSRPLFLHSQKGVGRTSAMVSRWREIGLFSSSSEEQTSVNPLNEQNFSTGPIKKLSKNISQPATPTSQEIDISSSNGTPKLEPKYPLEVLDDKNISGLRQEAAAVCRPFEAQRPIANFLSRREISEFLKGKQVCPGTFQSKGSKVLARQVNETSSPQLRGGAPTGQWHVDSLKNHQAVKEKTLEEMNGSIQTRYSRDPVTELLNIEQEESYIESKERDAAEPTVKTLEQRSNEGAPASNYGFDDSVDDDDDDDVAIVGDMCASTTGVVRLQSRRKAEMYLVRTDGFSCSREKVKEATLAFTHPSTQQQMLMWKTAPKTVLLLKKLGFELMEEAQQVASFLHYKEGMNVIVEPDVHDRFASIPGFGFIQTFNIQDSSNLHERIDFVVCLGGDGVILHASNIFRNAVPPVVSFNLGSLGFLTAHPFENFMQDLRAIIHGNTMVEGVYITLRMRLRCEIFRTGKPVPGKVFDILNEVVVDRGSSPYLCKIECYERNRLITKVQADGVIVATPTGSTAYSTAAGGSMVHPNVPCMLFTPICPHSLSFRPVILPDSALLEFKVPDDARSNAWVSFDGKRRQQLSRGDSVRICMSEHPLPTINKSDQTDDWFQSLVRCLNWNERFEQKPLS